MASHKGGDLEMFQDQRLDVFGLQLGVVEVLCEPGTTQMNPIVTVQKVSTELLATNDQD